MSASPGAPEQSAGEALPVPQLALAGRYRAALLVLFYTAVTAVIIAPIVNYAALGSASYEGDARLVIWTLAWNNHAVLTGQPLFESNTFHPAPRSLAYNEHLFGVSLFTLPIYAATRNPVLAYNVVWLLSWVLNALAAHALLRRYTGRDAAAAVGALVYTFSFYKMLHGHGHLHLVWTWLLPLSVLLLERWCDRPAFGRALAWGVAVCLQALTSWYLAVMVVIAQGAVLAGRLPALMRARRVPQLWHLCVTTLLVALVLWPFAAPYRELPAAEAREAAGNAADLAAYLIPPENTWIGQLWLAHIGRGPLWIWGERTVFIGWMALGFALLGAWALWRQRSWRLLATYITLAAAAAAFSFGPSATASGEDWSAFRLLAALPGLGAFRAPARFALLVLLGVSVLAAFGARLLLARGRAGLGALVLLVPLMLSEWYIVQFPAGKPQPFDVPRIYRHEALSTARALVSLPDYRSRPDWFRGADYLYFSTAHWRPIVNGFGRSEPADHFSVIGHMRAFPGPNNARTLRRLGVEYVVFHAARHPDDGRELVEAALASPEYELVGRIGSDYLFRVLPEPIPPVQSR